MVGDILLSQRSHTTWDLLSLKAVEKFGISYKTPYLPSWSEALQCHQIPTEPRAVQRQYDGLHDKITVCPLPTAEVNPCILS